jgi:hypothetical protein
VIKKKKRNQEEDGVFFFEDEIFELYCPRVVILLGRHRTVDLNMSIVRQLLEFFFFYQENARVPEGSMSLPTLGIFLYLYVYPRPSF